MILKNSDELTLQANKVNFGACVNSYSADTFIENQNI